MPSPRRKLTIRTCYGGTPLSEDPDAVRLIQRTLANLVADVVWREWLKEQASATTSGPDSDGEDEA